jgi:predicted dehydrogenase
MAQPLRVALVGQQFMGRAHSNAWGQAARVFDLKRAPVLEAVAARDARTLPAFARRWGWGRWTADWRDLAADERIDLVDVATPNHLHAEVARAMLRAGKHVACEKPLAGTLAQARAMRDAAARAGRSGVRSFVWFNYRRCPAVALAWQLVRQGRIGDIRHVRARYLQSWGGPETPLSWRFEKALAGSGAHGDLNAHIVDLARFLTGEEIEEIHGAAARTFVRQRTRAAGGVGQRGTRSAQGQRGARGLRGTSDVDDCLMFLAGLSGGGVASFEASRVATGHLNDHGIELNGARGSLRFDFEDMNALWLHEPAADGPRTTGWRRIEVTAAEHPWIARWWPEGHGLGYEHSFVNMAADIVTALSGRKPVVPLPDFADAYETQRVLEAALRSVARRRTIRMREVR